MNITAALQAPANTSYRGVVIEADGSRYYRHIATDVTVDEQTAGVREALEFAGEGATVVRIHNCTKAEHSSGIANCRFGES